MAQPLERDVTRDVDPHGIVGRATFMRDWAEIQPKFRVAKPTQSLVRKAAAVTAMPEFLVMGGGFEGDSDPMTRPPVRKAA